MIDEVNGVGLRFVQALCDALWYIDGQYKKFDSRCKHGKVPQIPAMFERFNKGDDHNKGGYNDWIAKKQKAPQLDSKELLEHGDRIITILSHPRLCRTQWKDVRNGVEVFAKCLKSYADEMKASLDRSESRHCSLHSLRTPDVNSESRDIPASKLPLKPIYARLMGSLESTDYYNPILVDTYLSVTDKHAKYHFFNNLELPCSVHLFVYHAGSQLGNIYYRYLMKRKTGLHNSKV